MLNIIDSAYQVRGTARLKDAGLINGQLVDVEILAGSNIIYCGGTGTTTENRLALVETYCISCDPDVDRTPKLCAYQAEI